MAGLDRRILHLQLADAEQLQREAARIAIWAIAAIAIHGLDAVTGRRLIDQDLQHAAHHALDARFQVGIHQRGDVDEELSRRRRCLIVGNRPGGGQQLRRARRRRGHARQRQGQRAVAAARMLRGKMFYRLVVAMCGGGRRMVATYQSGGGFAQALAQGGIAVQQRQRSAQLGHATGVRQL